MISTLTTASNSRFHKAITAAIVGAAFLFSSVPATAQISGVGTAVIDGTMLPGEWDGAGTVNFDINLPGGGTTPGTLFIMNDADNLYMALSFPHDATADIGNSFGVEFDVDASGGLSMGDDNFVVNSTLDPYNDGYRPSPGGAGTDTNDGGTEDGTGVYLNDMVTTVYEASKPLDSADDAHDFSLMAGDLIGFSVQVRIIDGSGTADTNLDGFGVFTQFLQVAETGATRILDFESQAHTGNSVVIVPSPYREDGFTIAAVVTGGAGGAGQFGFFGSAQSPFFSGSTALAPSTVPTTHTLTNDVNSPFTLVSMDVSEWQINVFGTALLTYTGINTSAAMVMHSFTLDQIQGSETIVFPATFSNLVSVSVSISAFGDEYHQIDNVVLEVQPGAVEPGDDVVVLPPDPDEPVTAAVQEVVKPGTIKQLSCVIEDDRGTARLTLDLVKKIKETQDCIDKGVAAQLEPTDKAKLKRHQRAFKDPADNNKKKIVVTLIRSKNTDGEPDDLTKGVVVSEEDATKQDVTDPLCNTAKVSDSPSTVGVNVSFEEPNRDKARNLTGTCNRTRSFGHFSDHIVAFPIKNDSAILSPHRQVIQEANDFRRAIQAELRSGCVNPRFLRQLRHKFNKAMSQVDHRGHRLGSAINRLNATTLFALAPAPAADPYGSCPNDPKGHLVSRLMDLTYHVHRGLRFPNRFVEFEIDPAILDELPPLPGDP